MILLLAAVPALAGQSARVDARAGADPVIEKLFYPAFQLHQTLDRAMRRAPQFRTVFTKLGDRACPVYLQAWRNAYDAHFLAYREATYAVVRRNVPKEVLSRPGLKLFDEAVVGQYGAEIVGEMNDGPAGAAVRQIGSAIVAEVFAATAGPAPAPGTEGVAEKALDAPGNLCQITVDAIERRGFVSQ